MLDKKISLLVLPLVATLSLQANDPFNDPFFKDPFGDNIFKEMMQMQENMDKMFQRMHQRMQQRSSRQISPIGTYKIQQKNDFADKGDSYEFITNIPESKENEIDIKSEKGRVSITAKIIHKEEKTTSNGYSSSSSMRMYQQSLALPKDVDESTLSMAYRDGYLVISVKKKKKITPIQNNQEKSKTKKEELLSPEHTTESKEETNATQKKIKLSDDTSMS